MKICKICGEKVYTRFEDYGCIAFRIPFINLKLWRFDFVHSKCREQHKRARK